MSARFCFRTVLGSILVVIALAVGAPLAHATLYPELSLEDLAEKSDAVVFVEVLRKEAQWLEGQRRIATFYAARPLTTLTGRLHGAESTAFTFVLPGGEVGDFGQVVAGTPSLEPGDRAIVFLSAPVGPRGERRVVGLGLGVLFAVPSSTDALGFRRGEAPKMLPEGLPRGDSPGDAAVSTWTFDAVNAAVTRRQGATAPKVTP